MMDEDIKRQRTFQWRKGCNSLAILRHGKKQIGIGTKVARVQPELEGSLQFYLNPAAGEHTTKSDELGEKMHSDTDT